MIDKSSVNYKVFKAVMTDSFSFLVDELHFSAQDCSGPIRVNYLYESEKIFIKFHYGPPGFEIDILIGRKGFEDGFRENALYLQEILSYCDVNVRSGFMAHSVSSIRTCVPELAQLMKRYGHPFLIGVDQDYEKLLQMRDGENEKWDESIVLKRVTEELNEAWRKKDYQKVVSTGKPFQRQLISSDIQKIEYAEKKSSEVELYWVLSYENTEAHGGGTQILNEIDEEVSREFASARSCDLR